MVIDTVTQLTYTLERTPLGEGATAKVWCGIREGKADQPSVAVKIAHRGTPAAALAEFWAELELLEKLALSGAGKLVPWAHRGRSPDEPGAAIIVMELIPDDWQLARLALATGRLEEGIALETASQYVQSLVNLHALGYCTRGDRKATDIRYDQKNKRLVVLDWNRAAPFPWDAGEEARREWVRQDIRGFGRIWAERVMGRAVMELPGIDETSVREWSGLTRGFRRILARSVGSRSAWGYESAEALLADLQQHLKWLARLHQEPAKQVSELLKEINDLVKRGQGESDVGLAAAVADSVLTLLDLAARVKIPEKDMAAAKLWAEMAGREAFQMVAEAADRVYDRLKLEDYRAAGDLAAEALQKLQGAERGSQTVALGILRWQILAALGVRGNELALDMSSAVIGLAVWLHSTSPLLISPTLAAQARPDGTNGNALRQEWISRLEMSRVELERLIERLPKAVAPLAEPFRLEVVIRAALTANRGDDSAAVRTLATYRTLRELHQTYAVWLCREVAELDRLVEAAEAGSTLETLRNERKSAFQAALAAIRERLTCTYNQPWQDLTDLLAPAREAFLNLGRLGDGADPDDRASFQFVSELSEVDRAFALGDYARGLHLASEMSNLVMPNDGQLTRDRAHRTVAAEVERILATPPYWPDERERAVRLLEAAGETAGDLAVEIEDWGQRLQRFRHELGLSAEAAGGGQQVIAWGPGRILDLEASQVDNVLTNALALEIEVVDRRWVPADQLPHYSVAALLGKRQMARLAASSDVLQAQVNRLSIELDGLGHRLAEAGEIGPKLREVDTVLADSQVALARLQQKLAVRHTETVCRAQELVEQIDRVKGILEKIPSELDNLQQLAATEEKSLAEIMEHSEGIESLIAKINGQLDRAERMPDRVEEQIRKLEVAQGNLLAAMGRAGGSRLQGLKVESQVLEGMIAVRRLDGKRAEQLGEQARINAGTASLEPYIQDAVALLGRSAIWLQKLPPNVGEALRKWRDALDEGNLRGAYNARSDFFFGASRNSDIEDFWLVAEMDQDYRLLHEIKRT